jgi:hypothetical protein
MERSRRLSLIPKSLRNLWPRQPSRGVQFEKLCKWLLENYPI